MLFRSRGDELDDRVVCRPDSPVARRMVAAALATKSTDIGLHRLGIALHVYVDTWAHQGFCGTLSRNNVVTRLRRHDWPARSLRHLWHRVWDFTSGWFVEAMADRFLRLGHGAASHAPDLPWLRWDYRNGHGRRIRRDNLSDFMDAANMLCRVVRAYLTDAPDFTTCAPLPMNCAHTPWVTPCAMW